MTCLIYLIGWQSNKPCLYDTSASAHIGEPNMNKLVFFLSCVDARAVKLIRFGILHAWCSDIQAYSNHLERSSSTSRQLQTALENAQGHLPSSLISLVGISRTRHREQLSYKLEHVLLTQKYRLWVLGPTVCLHSIVVIVFIVVIVVYNMLSRLQNLLPHFLGL